MTGGSCPAPTVITAPASGSWTVPATVTSVKIWTVGGGGGGAGSTGNDGTSGGAGGAGGVAYKTYSVTAGQPVTYGLGSGGSGGEDAANGNSGGNTTATYGGLTITATGGGGGQYNNNAIGPGGTGSGGNGAVTGGAGTGASGNTGGGGGGAIGGVAGTGGGNSGGTGGQSADVSGLQAAVTSAGYSWTGPGVGGGNVDLNISHGKAATGFGSGGGGAGFWGGHGGGGLYGGGGGGAAGYSFSYRVGGYGGWGAVVVSPVCAAPPPSCSVLNVNPSNINAGGTVTLTWSCQNVSSCNEVPNTNGFSTGGSPSGTDNSVTPSVTSGQVTYGLTCGTSTFYFPTVTVISPNVDISANPTRVRSGDESTITWSASGVKSCEVTGPEPSRRPFLASGNADNSNNFTRNSPYTTPSITAQSTYTIVCKTNGADATDSVIVNILPVVQEF